jgi:hypothetical protein
MAGDDEPVMSSRLIIAHHRVSHLEGEGIVDLGASEGRRHQGRCALSVVTASAL